MTDGRWAFVVAAHEKVLRPAETGGDLRPESHPDWYTTGGEAVRGRRILDVGCGTALDVWYLAADNQVVGLDVTPTLLHWAQQHGVQPLLSDADGVLPFPDASFDFVVAKDVFEHLLDPTGLLREMHRVLRPSGVLVANVPNHFFFWGRLRLLWGKGLRWKTIFGDHTQFYEEWDYQHVRFFTWAGFQRFLAQVAFARIEYIWEFGELLYHPQEAILARFDADDFTRRRWSALLRLLVRAFFFLFRKRLRVVLARWRPGLFAASFYARCTKP
jgi:SAM-dependent methyltransferase